MTSSARAPATTARSGLLALAACVGAGALSVLSFAPFYLWFVPFLSLALLAWLIDRASSPRSAAWLGLAFGLGHFLAGTSWIYVSLHDFGGMSVPLAAFATAFFCTYLALFTAATAWLMRGIDANRGVRLVLAFPAAWTLAEWARGWVFTGFPWIALGYSQAPDGPLAGLAPVFGTYGVSLGAAAVAGALAWWLPHSRASLATIKAHPVRLVAVPAALIGLYLATSVWLGKLEWTRPAGAPVKVTLVQGNIAQDLKWRPEAVRSTLEIYLRQTLASRSRLILLPETALPLFNTEVPPEYLDLLAQHARTNGGDLLLGMPEYVAAPPPRYYNSVMNLGTAPVQTYRKFHLVPFGDYFPRWFFITWVMNALDIPMSDFSRGPKVQRPIEVAGERIAANICYEDAFGEELIRQLPEATLLANFTNDAWWGNSIAAEQHLQMAQMRALETGRYMLRATNTGVTAIIDERGRVRARLPGFVTDSLTGAAQGFSGATPYVRWGNWPVLTVAWAMLVAAVTARRWRLPALERPAVHEMQSSRGEGP